MRMQIFKRREVLLIAKRDGFSLINQAFFLATLKLTVSHNIILSIDRVHALIRG
jgi:hypothetical protein